MFRKNTAHRQASLFGVAARLPAGKLKKLRASWAYPFYQLTVAEGTITIKPSDQLDGSTLQSPDDIDATYRKKRNEAFRGQFATMLYAQAMAIAVNFGRIWRYLSDHPTALPLCRRLLRLFFYLPASIARNVHEKWGLQRKWQGETHSKQKQRKAA